MIFRKILLLVAIVISICLSQRVLAEYIFCHKDDTKITEEEHKDIYQALIYYQFPMCLCNPDAKEHACSTQTYDEAELIKRNISKNIKIIQVPSAVYELLCIKEYIQKLISSDWQVSDNKFKSSDVFVETVNTISHNYPFSKYNKKAAHFCLQTYLSAMKEFNKSEHLQKLHFMMNKICWNAMKRDIQIQVLGLLEEIYDLCIKNDDSSGQVGDLILKAFSEEKRDLAAELINCAVQTEQRESTEHILYRGTNGIYAKLDSTNNTSLSFGTCLFSGVFKDSRGGAGACPFNYMMNSNIAYCVKINKCDYLSDGESSQLFFIPPISRLAALCLTGECFHPRSNTAGSHINGRGFQAAVDLPKDYIINTNLDATSLECKFQDFLKNFGAIIKRNLPRKCNLPRAAKNTISSGRWKNSNLVIAGAASAAIAGAAALIVATAVKKTTKKPAKKSHEKNKTICIN